MPVLSTPSCSNPSMMRPTHHAQAVVAPALCDLPCRSKNQPDPWLALFCCAAQASLPKLILPTVEGTGTEMPPTPMMAAPELPFEKVTVTVLVLLPTLMLSVMVVPDRLAVSESGGPGRSPSSYCCSILLISAWRHFQSSAVATAFPSANFHGSGSCFSLTAA